MKKKLLSLVLAGAMVASTSVSAFADVVKSENGKDIDHKIEVTGNVAKTTDNTILPGTISVDIPTNTSFTIDKNGGIIAPEINVRNTGTEKVEVYAYKFTDPTTTGGITVKRTLENNDTRDKITLYLSGEDANAYFGSDVERGIYKSNALDEEIDNPDGVKLASLARGQNVNLSLKGAGGTSGNNLDTPLQERFTLQLKIKKSASQNIAS